MRFLSDTLRDSSRVILESGFVRGASGPLWRRVFDAQKTQNDENSRDSHAGAQPQLAAHVQLVKGDLAKS